MRLFSITLKCFLAALLVFSSPLAMGEEQEEIEMIQDMELLENWEILEDLEFYEDFDVLESLSADEIQQMEKLTLN